MKKFYMVDDDFICENCNRYVSKLKVSARDHCPYCLFSKHVDINPGDRKNSCQGLLVPFDIEKYKNTYKIVYKCSKCGQIHKNIIANDDNMEEIISLSVKSS